MLVAIGECAPPKPLCGRSQEVSHTRPHLCLRLKMREFTPIPHSLIRITGLAPDFFFSRFVTPSPVSIPGHPPRLSPSQATWAQPHTPLAGCPPRLTKSVVPEHSIPAGCFFQPPPPWYPARSHYVHWPRPPRLAALPALVASRQTTLKRRSLCLLICMNFTILFS